MMKVYPIFLNDLHRRRCVVIGGGHEAERKVESLLECEANVTLINAEVTETLRDWAANGRITWLPRPYQPGDLKGAFLVICEGEDPAENAQVWAEGEAEGILVNVMDDIPHCSFVAGSVIRQGPLALSISTSGAAPALAVRLRERFEQEFDAAYGQFLEMAQALRAPMAERYPPFAERKRIWYELVDSDVLDLLRQGNRPAALDRIEAVTGIRLT
jgi:precorrin-2 dehydrogenase / sirohydrochlorin ferrochelatase